MVEILTIVGGHFVDAKMMTAAPVGMGVAVVGMGAPPGL